MYRAPVRELRFVLEELLGARQLSAAPELADYSDELAQSVLEEAARFAEEVLEPLNRPGDTAGARWTPEGVVTAPGFREAYRQFVAGGWPRSGRRPEFGGQRVPRALSTAVAGVLGLGQPRLQAVPHADASAPCTRSSCAARPGSSSTFLPPMVQRRMDRHHGAHRAAGRLGPGRGAHACGAGGRSLPPVRPEDLHHLGRSRPHAQHHPHGARPHRRRAPGVKGISLFIVPKFLVNADGSLGRAQRGALRVHRAQARHPREPHLRAWPTATSRARSAISWASPTAASNTCSS